MPDPGTLVNPPAHGAAPGSGVDPKIMAALMRLSARQRQVVALRLILDLDVSRSADVPAIPCRARSAAEGGAAAAPGPPFRDQTTIIRPSALPGGAGIQFIATSNIGHLQTYGTHMLGVWLVQASPQCTGT